MLFPVPVRLDAAQALAEAENRPNTLLEYPLDV
jgi:hypothetical protein